MFYNKSQSLTQQTEFLMYAFRFRRIIESDCTLSRSLFTQAKRSRKFFETSDFQSEKCLAKKCLWNYLGKIHFLLNVRLISVQINQITQNTGFSAELILNWKSLEYRHRLSIAEISRLEIHVCQVVKKWFTLRCDPPIRAYGMQHTEISYELI